MQHYSYLGCHLGKSQKCCENSNELCATNCNNYILQKPPEPNRNLALQESEKDQGQFI